MDLDLRTLHRRPQNEAEPSRTRHWSQNNSEHLTVRALAQASQPGAKSAQLGRATLSALHLAVRSACKYPTVPASHWNSPQGP